MKIKAAVVDQQGTMQTFQELELIEPRANEVRVKLVASGVCHTDLAHTRNDWNMPLPMPMVMGHEGSGIVESVGPGVSKVKPGDHVLISNPFCGECEQCAKGEQWYCKPGTDTSLHLGGLDYHGTTPLTRDGKPVHTLFQQGSFATGLVTHQNTITKIDPTIDLKIAGPLGCGFRTGAGAVYNILAPKPCEWVCIAGVGPLGLAAQWMAQAMGAKTLVIDINEARLNMARETGATAVVNTRGMNIEEMVAAMRAAADGEGTHYMVETTGVENVYKAAMKQMRGGGKAAQLNIIGKMGFESYFNDCNDTHTITFSRMGNVANDVIIPVMLDLYKRGMFPFDKLLTFYPFEELQRAYEDSEAGRVIKPVVVFD